MAMYPAPATHTVSSSMSVHRIMQWEGMGQMQDAGWVGGDTCRILRLALKGFWWGSAPQMLLVMGSSMELRESEMSTCGTLGHALEVAIAHTSYMRGA